MAGAGWNIEGRRRMPILGLVAMAATASAGSARQAHASFRGEQRRDYLDRAWHPAHRRARLLRARLWLWLRRSEARHLWAGRCVREHSPAGAAPNPGAGAGRCPDPGATADHQLALATRRAADQRRGRTGDRRRADEPKSARWRKGFAAGFNRYVREFPRAKLPAACRRAAWSGRSPPTDVLNRSLGVATLLSSGLLQNEMFNAAPPGRGSR